MKLKRANQPHHGLGEHGAVHRKGGLMGVGEHMPARVDAHTGTGNSKGSAPPTKGHPSSVKSHLGTSGRGGTGRHGKADNFKGKATDLSEAPTSAWFESLGSK